MGALVIMGALAGCGFAVVLAAAGFDAGRDWFRARRPWRVWRPETGELIRDHSGRVLRFRSWRDAQRFIGRTRSGDICPVRGFRVRVRRVTGV